MDPFLKTHRIWLLTLVGLGASLVTWALVARVDIVVTAQGKLLPTSFVNLAQPLETAIVRKLHVKDGAAVGAGELLVELDSVLQEANQDSAKAELAHIESQLDRVKAELSQDFSRLTGPAKAEAIARAEAVQSDLTVASSQLVKSASDLLSAKQDLEKAVKLEPLRAEQKERFEKLVAVGFVSKDALSERDAAWVSSAQDVLLKEHVASAATAAVRASEAELHRIRQAYRRDLLVEEAQLRAKKDQSIARVQDAAHRQALRQISAPVAGTVTGLTIRNAGQVVNAGAVLLSIVPDGQPFRYEGWLKNEDAAFVAPGMPAKVKLQGYPFQKYGWLTGEVTWVGVDAETPESMKNQAGEPLFYRVRIDVPQVLEGQSGPQPLRSGMQGVADIQIGDRTLFEYLTSPLKKVAMEAARER